MMQLKDKTQQGRSRALVCYLMWAFLLLMPTYSLATLADDQTDPAVRLKQLQATLSAKQQEKAALEKASENAKSDAEKLSRDLVIAGNNVHIAEANVERIEDRVNTLEAEVSLKKAALNSREHELLNLLAALERLSKRPAALALLQPREALETAQSASLMGTLVPQIHAMAAELKADIKSLSVIQNKLSKERFRLKNTLVKLTQTQENLSALLKKRRSEADSASYAARQTATEIDVISREAKNLKDLIAELAKRSLAKPDRPRPQDLPGKEKDFFKPDSRPISQMKGYLSVPAIGRIIQRFGEKLAVGSAKGVRFKVRPGAQVVAPYDGQVVFSGPFREYGNLVIIEHDGGYHSLLSGMGELYNSVGQWVLSGEPIGQMSATDKGQTLYMELRRKGGTPLDPEKWLDKRLITRR